MSVSGILAVQNLPMLKYLPALFAASLFFIGCKPKPAEPIFVGMKVYKLYDSSRSFDTTAASKNTFRPVKIDVFYPSTEKPVKSTLTYGDIMDMYEQRFNYDTPIDTCKKMSLQLANMFAGYLHVNPAKKFLTYKLSMYDSLSLPDEKHPLIIYAAGMNGSAWDNPVLFDSLASNGYVVAVVSSVGKFPGYMSGAVDIDEQVQDILYTIKQMKAMPYIDGDKIGIVSWSLGGTAAAKAAMLTKDIKAIISYDGTDIHAYGPDKDWDKEYDEIRNIAPTNAASIAVPYMYLRSEHPNKIDSMYSVPALASSPSKYFVKFTDAIHEDFSSLPFIGGKVEPYAKNIHSNYHIAISKLTLLFFDEFVKRAPSTHLGSYINELAKKDSALYKTGHPAY